MMSTMKQISVKQAQKWLEKLKNQSSQSYKEIVKFLRKYEKNEDEYDCYVKMNSCLLAHYKLTNQLNTYMEEPNKLVINKPQQEKIKDFMAYIKKNKPDIFEKIIQMITDLSNSGQQPGDISSVLKPRLRMIVKGDPELERITQEALDTSGEQLLSRKNLEYLKIPKINLKEQPIQPPKPGPKQPQTKNNIDRDYNQNIGRVPPFPRPPKQTTNIGPFTNPSQERTFLRQLQKSVDEKTYSFIIKIMRLYYLAIITKNEVFDLFSNVQLDDILMDCIKQIIQTRESDRRKYSVFRPLNDMNFSDYDRASPSYVTLPHYYPIKASGRTSQLKNILNAGWVSVPYGSEQNFNIRNKNINEANLIKAEDERYEFDLYMKKTIKVLNFFDRLLDQSKPLGQNQKQNLINKIISMGVVQTIYKTSNNSQKQELQWMLKVNDVETCKIFRERINSQINELKNIRQIHANKAWNEVASKNFYKALDLKGFQFKKNEKQRMKGQYFLNQLQQRHVLRDNGGVTKNIEPAFDDKKDFFSIFNSFSSISRSQKCNTRQLPQIQTFNLLDTEKRHLYPLLIIAFENQSVCQEVYTLILFYLDNTQIGESEKIKCKVFLEQFLIYFLGWKKPLIRSLKEYDDQKFYSKITGSSQQIVDFKSWIKEQMDIEVKDQKEQQQQEHKKLKHMCILKDEPNKYSYLPAKSNEKMVLYSTQHIYALCRFIYTLYERLIKMKEVAETPEKIDLFYILIYSCIKAKQSNKFEQGLNSLFGKHAYLFSTMYRLLDSLIKSAISSVNCPLTTYSFKNMNGQSQQLYFVLINRFCLNNNFTNNKLLRLTYNRFDKVIYFNYLDSYYKSDEIGKDIIKKRADISKAIEVYTVESLGPIDSRKKRKTQDLVQHNGMEYVFEGSTIKMLNEPLNQDILYHEPGRKTNQQKIFKRQLKRGYKLLERIA